MGGVGCHAPASAPPRGGAGIESSERGGIWTLETGVFPENEPSLRLLQRFGFRVVGTRERIGRMHGMWRDVIFLERRSEVVG